MILLVILVVLSICLACFILALGLAETGDDEGELNDDHSTGAELRCITKINNKEIMEGS